eukprot:COSAG01_NODE_3313_length_6277_cov_6.940758_6_plen_216_part_00
MNVTVAESRFCCVHGCYYQMITADSSEARQCRAPVMFPGCMYPLFPHRVPHFQVGFAPARLPPPVAPTHIVLVAGVCASLEAAAILAGRAELASAEVEVAPLRPRICAHDLEFVDIATAVPAVSSRAENLRPPRQPEDEVLLVCAVGAARLTASLRARLPVEALVPTGRIRPRPGWWGRAVCAAGGEAPRSSRLHSTSKREKNKSANELVLMRQA